MPILSAYEQLQAVAAAGEGSELLKPLPEQARRLKSEEPEVVDDVSMPDAEVPAPVVVTTTRAGRASKTATPMSSTFPDLGPRNRSIRTKDQAGSHASSESGERTRRKKGAGSAAASLRAENDNVADEVSDANEGDEAELEDLDPEEIADVEDVEEEGNEPKYCYCNDVSYGEMVACDNENCAKEWFHIKCAGLSRAPDENSKLSFAVDGVEYLLMGFSQMVLHGLQGCNVIKEVPTIESKRMMVNGLGSMTFLAMYWDLPTYQRCAGLVAVANS